MRPPARRLVAKFVGMNALSLPGVNMDGACIIIVRTCRTCFFFFLTSSLLWPICQPTVQTLVSKSAGSTIVAFMRSLRFRNNEGVLTSRFIFCGSRMASCTSLAWNVCQNQGKLRHEGRQCFRCGRVARRIFFRGGGSCVKDFLRRFRWSRAAQVTGTN